jgi:hypothetical protein
MLIQAQPNIPSHIGFPFFHNVNVRSRMPTPPFQKTPVFVHSTQKTENLFIYALYLLTAITCADFFPAVHRHVPAHWQQ